MSGVLGRLSWPVAAMNTSASCPAPPGSVSRQVPLSSSKAAARTSVPKRMCRTTSKSRATSRRYWWISACGANRRDQSALGANDSE